MDILLCFVTCGIYTIYLQYKIGKMESESLRASGLTPKDDSVLYVILSIFGLFIVNYALMQSNINSIADTTGPGPGTPYTPPQDPQQPSSF